MKIWIMKAQTQVRIGLITAGILFIAGIYILVFWWNENISVIPLYFSPQMVLCLIYIFALIRNKLKIAQKVYDILWATGLVYIVVIIGGSPKWGGNILEDIIQLLLCFCLPYGGVVLLWRIGIKGLEQVIQTEHLRTSKNNK
ncbi:MAG: hypothetical protein ACYS0C_09610 [Planctomycetota bacterium]|jgi:hypothetical protein